MRLRLPTGLVLYVPPWSRSGGEAWYTTCNVDWGSERLLWETLEPNGTFLDVGAHIGYYSLYMAPAVARVYAFEPEPRAFAALRDNLTAVKHAHPVPVAVIGNSHTGDNGVTIDTWMAERPAERLTAIKVDIDGRDMAAVAGAAETIRRDQPLILMEVNAPGSVRAGLGDLADMLGYRTYAFSRGRKEVGSTFRPLGDGVAPDQWVKNVFLAPQRLWANFDHRAKSNLAMPRIDE